MTDQIYRPTEDSNTPFNYHYYQVVVVITAPADQARVFIRNAPYRRNISRVIDGVIRDILSYEGLQDFGTEFTIQTKHLTTTDPENLPYDPDHPEG